MSEPLSTKPAPSPFATPAPLPCLNCSYNLAGLPSAGVCPECQCSVAVSARSHRGEFLAEGKCIACRGVLLLFAFSVLSLIDLAFRAAEFTGYSLPSFYNSVDLLVGFVVLVLAAAAFYNFAHPWPLLLKDLPRATKAPLASRVDHFQFLRLWAIFHVAAHFLYTLYYIGTTTFEFAWKLNDLLQSDPWAAWLPTLLQWGLSLSYTFMMALLCRRVSELAKLVGAIKTARVLRWTSLSYVPLTLLIVIAGEVQNLQLVTWGWVTITTSWWILAALQSLLTLACTYIIMTRLTRVVPVDSSDSSQPSSSPST